MTSPRQLTSRDVLFVGGETPTIHQHTSGLTLLDATDRPDFGYDKLRSHVEGRLAQIPHFRWKLHEVPLGIDLPYWVEDEDFSFDHHLRRIGCPAPGDREALAELAAYLYSRHLDRSRPLWETWFIDGLGDGKFALFTKLHHSMMDGEGASTLGAIICDLEPDAAPRDVDPAIAESAPGLHPEPWRQSANAVGHLATLPVRAGWEVLDGARRAVSQRVAGRGAGRETPRAPTTRFNCGITRERGFVYGALPLADIKAVKDHFDVTLNDVVLALVAGSLRSYLGALDELPEESLRTGMAVSLRTHDDDEFSNRVTTASTTLATALADPVERLRAIAADTAAAKIAAHSGGKGFLEFIGLMPPALVGLLMSSAPASIVPRFAGYNLLVSSVRGSPVPLYIAGAQVTAMYPMSIIAPGGALNVTCISYGAEMDFGFTIEPSVFPDRWDLVAGLEASLAEYMAVLPGRRSRKAGGSPRGRR